MPQFIPANLLLAYAGRADAMAADEPSRSLARGLARVRAIVSGGRADLARSRRGHERSLVARPVHAA